MTWTSIKIDGEKKSLKHLRDFTFNVAVHDKQSGQDYDQAIRVKFSSHCFTRSPENPDDVILNFGNDRRCFCETRYQHSFRLKEIIQSLDERHVRNTGRGNFFTIEFIDEEGQRLNYEVYFKLSKSKNKDQLQLFVQSAYIRTRNDPYRSQKKRVRFGVLVNAVKHGRRIKI